MHRSIYGKPRREVQENVAQLGYEVNASMHGSVAGSTNFREFALDWLLHRRRRTKTMSGYRSIARNHLDIIGDVLLVKLRPVDIQQHYTRKLQVRKPTTVQHIHSFFHVVLEHAVRLDMITQNPAAYVEAPGLHPEEMLPLTKQEVRHFLHTIKDEHFEAFFVMALGTGMREAELLGLRWADINWERARVRCHATLHRVEGKYRLEEMKSRSSLRTLPLLKAPTESLRRYQSLQHDDQAAIGDEWQDKWGCFSQQRPDAPFIRKRC